MSSFVSFLYRHCIQNQNDKCPIDGTQCTVKIANLNITEQIDDLQINCMYGVKLNELNMLEVDENGCTMIISHGNRQYKEYYFLINFILFYFKVNMNPNVFIE